MGERDSNDMDRRQFMGKAAAIGAGALTLGATVTGGVAHSARQADEPEPLDFLPPGADWTRVAAKSDDFTGTGLDTTKWGTKHWNPVSRGVQFTGDNTIVAGGNLHIRISKKDDPPDDGAQYWGGYAKSKFTIGGNSYTEVRARMVNHNAGVNSAIWLHEKADEATNPNVEIDMQEYQDPHTIPQQVHSALHLWHIPNGHTPVAHTDWNYPGGNLDAQFHHYGLERRNNRLNFYLDGVRYWTYDTSEHPALATQRQPLILYIRGLAQDPVDSVLPADMLVDYVHVYRAT